jgi:serine protease Do
MKYFLRPYRYKGSLTGTGLSGARKQGRRFSGLLSLGLVGGMLLGSAPAQAAQYFGNSGWFLLHSRAGYMGVIVGDVDQERAAALHLKDTRGAQITVLDHDAPAAKMGLKLYDVVVKMNGVDIENAEQMKKMLHAMPVGRKVQLEVNHDGVVRSVTVQMADRYKMLEEAQQQETKGTTQAQGQTFLDSGRDMQTSGGMNPWLGSSLHVGALIEPLEPQTAEFLGLDRGVMIKSVARKSAADAAGLKVHDVILEIGGESVSTSSDWERLLRASEGKPVQVTILRDRTKQLVLLQVTGKHVKN